MQPTLRMPNKKPEGTPSNSVVQPISMKRDFFNNAQKAAQIEGLTFAAYTRRLIHQDLVKKGIISIE